MADITMCRDETCKKRERCYRFTARATPEYQSYFVDSPREGKECKYFSDNEDKTKRMTNNIPHIVDSGASVLTIRELNRKIEMLEAECQALREQLDAKA
jgi:uncharacterized small protein (DUF1192 family)